MDNFSPKNYSTTHTNLCKTEECRQEGKGYSEVGRIGVSGNGVIVVREVRV